MWRGWGVGLDAALFFWFGFVVCEAVWIVVPLALGACAWRRILAAPSAHLIAPAEPEAEHAASEPAAPPAAPPARPKLRLPLPTRGHAELFKRA